MRSSKMSSFSATGCAETNGQDNVTLAIIRTLKRELADTRAQRDAAEVHAVMAQREAAVWKYRFNKKKEAATEPTRRIHTSSRVVTNDQGLREAQEDREKQQEKKRKEAEKKARK